MKKQRIYLDTSVFGGFFDHEFQEFTKPLFERITRGEFTILFSTLLEEELEFAPENVRKSGPVNTKLKASPRDLMNYETE